MWRNSDLILAKKLTEKVQDVCTGLEEGDAPILGQVSEATGELLRFWFQKDYCDLREINFHDGQKQAILNLVYAHEVLETHSLAHLYEQVAPEGLLSAAADIKAEKNNHPKYCHKMATGVGKTWVLQAFLIASLLNANRGHERYTKNFLIVAPGLIVRDRLQEAFQGKLRGGERDFQTSDAVRFEDLFIPEPYRNEVFQFMQNNFCVRDDIGRKTTGGLLAITNWQAIIDKGDDDFELLPGEMPDPRAVVKDLLPLTPGTAQGNDLAQLDRGSETNRVLDFLRDLDGLMVFNDEAHRIHEVRSGGEVEEVEWQKSLDYIAEGKKQRFIQVDFSATPYVQVGSGKKEKKAFFPHIIVDFDLRTAMHAGLVKALVLVKRSEIGAIPNEEISFRTAGKGSDRELSEGQRIMLRAGLKKLAILESGFAALDDDRHPKMLVVVEDTNATKLVADFIAGEPGFSSDDILHIDSGKKAELNEKKWNEVRERLFDLDKNKQPRVVVNVLMLREGFDVNNICVIVPLRAAGSKILLEQTIGRGLRLMWREGDYDDQKRENRQLIQQGSEPNSLIDVLSIVEHPKFLEFYSELMADGLVGEAGDDPEKNPVGDLIKVPLRPDFMKFDFGFPVIIEEPEEYMRERVFEVDKLDPFTSLSFDALKKFIGDDENFVMEDVQSKTRIGGFSVRGGIMTATGYNDYISRIVKRLGLMFSQDFKEGTRAYSQAAQFPYLQMQAPDIAAWMDTYIRTRLFGRSFDPMEGKNWRMLLLDEVFKHIVKEAGHELIDSGELDASEGAEVNRRYLSEVTSLTMREKHSIEVNKCIYPRLSYSAKSVGLEKPFIEWADKDASVKAFCKIHEYEHRIAKQRYLKEDGILSWYSPDFVVKIGEDIYLVETKATSQVSAENVKRKARATIAWCNRVNRVEPMYRDFCEWHYVLLSEDAFNEWKSKNATMGDMLKYFSLRDNEGSGQKKLGL